MLAEGCGEERGEAIAPSCGGDCLVPSRASGVCPVTILRFLEAVVMLSKPAVKPEELQDKATGEWKGRLVCLHHRTLCELHRGSDRCMVG